MKDTYLAGNEIIKSALAETNAEMNDNVVMNSVDAGQQRIMKSEKPSEDNFKHENQLMKKLFNLLRLSMPDNSRRELRCPTLLMHDNVSLIGSAISIGR